MTKLTVITQITAPVAVVWHKWTNEEEITKWNFASDDWCCPMATNDLKVDGEFSTRMEAKDGSFGFDFVGVYTEVTPLKSIAYSLGDKREVQITFSEKDGVTTVVETFDPENENPLEMQQAGWQAIMDNFKAHVLSSMSQAD